MWVWHWTCWTQIQLISGKLCCSLSVPVFLICKTQLILDSIAGLLEENEGALLCSIYLGAWHTVLEMLSKC